ncbi:hypothetical protein BHM03_00048307 [Ensete ventricosum]|nr:hypothetical protein BHM03_00048307 [Ensete ventricosum]
MLALMFPTMESELRQRGKGATDHDQAICRGGRPRLGPLRGAAARGQGRLQCGAHKGGQRHLQHEQRPWAGRLQGAALAARAAASRVSACAR